MPWIDALLDAVGEARILSTIDLTKVSWQIPLVPEAREKTAFMTHSGIYYLLKIKGGDGSEMS